MWKQGWGVRWEGTLLGELFLTLGDGALVARGCWGQRGRTGCEGMGGNEGSCSGGPVAAGLQPSVEYERDCLSSHA